MWERIQKIAILKQLPTHFKAKREKAAVTPFQRVPAPLHPWASEGGRRGLGSLQFGNFSKKRLFSLLRVAKTKFHQFWSPPSQFWKNPLEPPLEKIIPTPMTV